MDTRTSITACVLAAAIVVGVGLGPFACDVAPPPPDPDPTATPGGPAFVPCESFGDEDDGIDFTHFGETRIVASTIGQGRHVALLLSRLMVYEFDRPVPFCAVVPDNFTLTDLDTDTVIAFGADQLVRDNIVDGDGKVVASQILITLPDAVVAGHDYELVFDDEALGLDGEFQVTTGSGVNLKSNGTLPSGDGEKGGDFIQRFRAVGALNWLTGTTAAAGLALDAADAIYIVGEEGLHGPFDGPAVVDETKRLGRDLPALASRVVAVNNDGKVIVKGSADGKVFEVDPETGTATQIAAADLTSFPNSIVVAPPGYSSIETANVEAGDLLFSDSSGISIPDLAAAEGRKGGLNLVDRGEANINSVYLKLFVPPARGTKPREVYAAFRPEDDTGFEIIRILPNGVEDRSVFTTASSLVGVDATAAIQLENYQGREEFLIIGRIDTSLLPTKQLLPSDFDGRCVMIYNKATDRLQILMVLDIDAFAFTFGPFSDLAVTSDWNSVYVSLPTAGTVVRFNGLANGADAAGDPPCGGAFDDGLDFSGQGSVKVVRSSVGNGRYLLKGSPTVIEFECDRPLRFCDVTPDNVTLTETASGTVIPLDDDDVRRVKLRGGAGTDASKIVIDLPDSLVAGQTYELTLDAAGLGLDGEFNANGTLPSGDGTAGGDFVQTFQLVEAGRYLTNTSAAVGITIDADNRLFVANETDLFGPFAGPKSVTAADELGAVDRVARGGRPIGVDADGNVIFAALQDGNVFSVDPDTGVATELVSGAGGSSETDLVIAPAGYAGTIASAGDIIILNENRAFVPDLAAGTGKVDLFSNGGGLPEYVSASVPPVALFGPLVIGAFSDTDPITSARRLQIRELTGSGLQNDVLPNPLVGMTASNAIRLRDHGSASTYLLLGDFDPDAAAVLTRQTRGIGTGLELMIYSPEGDRLEILGIVGRGDEEAVRQPEPDLAFEQDLDTVYLTQPEARTVVRLIGLGD